jgi:hypothetical protein
MLNSDLRAELVDPAAGRLAVPVTASQVGEVDAVNVAAPPIALEAAWGRALALRLEAVAAVRAEIRGHGAALAELGARFDALAADDLIGPTDVEFKHRLLMIVPIVSFLLNYEGEVELKSRLGLDAVWQALATKIRWR